MTHFYFTIDTEYSAGLALRAGTGDRAGNFARSIACDTPRGSVGVTYQAAVLAENGLKGVFFVDPFPALVWGVAAVRAVVEPVLELGHDVQLHAHTEWLELAGDANPLGKRTGRNIGDFSLDEQVLLLGLARDLLVEAGCPAPVAFRAGNYGANDDTLRALAAIGLRYDSSHCPGIADGECRIGLNSAVRQPVERHGVIEVPVGAIGTPAGGLRHYQLTALSSAELLGAARHAVRSGHDCLTLVSHSFELLSRDRSRINRVVQRRFEALCAGLSQIDGLVSATYRDNPPAVAPMAEASVLPPSRWRTGWRLAEQAAVNALYGAR